ncbi:hypothetical protein HMPREF0971_01166 [Segatella oris F0302]|uniref:Uncharacterized protein n=1 Tax=Segatella oris F0302 TaxID=649760 RepID=D1QQB7_9BACT|nr:hypothetical protein HMPREF0971_01166 [Segatella oris F0302]
MKFICIASACFKNGFSLLVATHYYICRCKDRKINLYLLNYTDIFYVLSAFS